MDKDQLRDIIAELPDKVSRSRLEPYRELIAQLRRHRRTYREIAQLLAEKCQLHVSATAVLNFVRLHLRRERSPYKRRSTDSIGRTQISPTKVTVLTAQGNNSKKQRPATDKEVWQRIAELKQRPVPTETNPKQFHYDSDEPLHLVSKAEGDRPSDED